MSFDVVVVERISDEGFQAVGIINGSGPVEIFYGVEHSILANLKLAQASASDQKVWLTESAFAEVSDILDEVYKRCHGVVKDRGYHYCNEVGRHKYECYFDKNSIVREFCVKGQEKTETCPDGSVVRTHICIPPDFVATGVTCTTECKTGDSVGKNCPDGTHIDLKRCVGGKWIATGNHCPGTDDGTCSDVTETCADGSIITKKRCVDGALVDTGATCSHESGKNTGILMAFIAIIIGLYIYLRG